MLKLCILLLLIVNSKTPVWHSLFEFFLVAWLKARSIVGFIMIELHYELEEKKTDLLLLYSVPYV